MPRGGGSAASKAARGWLGWGGSLIAGTAFAGLLAHGYDTLVLESQLELTTVLALELQATGHETSPQTASELEKCNMLTPAYREACVSRAMTKARLM